MPTVVSCDCSRTSCLPVCRLQLAGFLSVYYPDSTDSQIAVYLRCTHAFRWLGMREPSCWANHVSVRFAARQVAEERPDVVVRA